MVTMLDKYKNSPHKTVTFDEINQYPVWRLDEAYRLSHILYIVDNGRVVGTDIEYDDWNLEDDDGE